MATKRDVLEFIGQRSNEKRSTTFEEIAEEYDLHPLSACDHLKRLWRERLIRAVPPRPRGSRYCLQPGERLEDLRFRLAPRGKERLEWYEQQDEKDEDNAWF